MSENNLLDSTGCLDNYCANDHILSLGPKRSIETKHFKKSSFNDDKSSWPIFPLIIESDKPRQTVFKGPQAILTITVAFIREFFGTNWLFKTQIFEKKEILPVKKHCGHFYLVVSNMTNVKEQSKRVWKVF